MPKPSEKPAQKKRQAKRQAGGSQTPGEAHEGDGDAAEAMEVDGEGEAAGAEESGAAAAGGEEEDEQQQEEQQQQAGTAPFEAYMPSQCTSVSFLSG